MTAARHWAVAHSIPASITAWSSSRIASSRARLMPLLSGAAVSQATSAEAAPSHTSSPASASRSSLCPLPETCEVLTGGGGRHLYLEVPEGTENVLVDRAHVGGHRIGRALDIPVYRAPAGTTVPDIVRGGLEAAKRVAWMSTSKLTGGNAISS